MTTRSPSEQARAFLGALFDARPARTVMVVCQQPRWNEAAAYRAVDPIVERVIGGADYYVGACPLARAPGRGGRGKASEAAFLPGAWIDVDIDGSPIRGSEETVSGHAPDTWTALAAVFALAEPTLVVNSGYGLQPWWLLEHGAALHDGSQQDRAHRLVLGLQCRLERDAGWKVDATADLARVMRIPGTLNTKGREPVPVTLLDGIGPRYTLERLEALGWHEPPGAATVEDREPRNWAQIIADGVDVGERHDRIWQLTGYLLRRGLDPAVAYELVRAFNDARVRPPYDELTVRRHFKGIARLEADRRRGEFDAAWHGEQSS